LNRSGKKKVAAAANRDAQLQEFRLVLAIENCAEKIVYSTPEAELE